MTPNSHEPPPTPKRRLSIGRLIAFAILALTITLLASIRISLQNRLDKSLAEIRAAGLPASPSEIIAWRPLPPPSQNGAPALLEACEQIRLFGATTNSSFLSSLLRTNRWSPELRAQLDAHLVTNRVPLQKIEAALNFSQFGFIADYSQGFQTDTSHLTLLRNAAALFSIRSALLADRGLPDESSADILRLVRLAQTLDREPLVISWLVRSSLIRVAVMSTERLLNRAPPSPASSQNLHRAFAELSATNLLPQALIGERAASLSLFHLAKTPPANAPPPNQLEQIARGLGATGFSLTGFFERDQAFYLRTMQRAIEFASLPPPGSLLLTNFMAQAEAEMESKRYILSGMVMVAAEGLTVRAAETHAFLSMAQTSLAIESFRQSQGALPQNLKNLIPEFLEFLPIDPFDGQLLRYQTDTRGYRLWSIGPDCKDDRGVAPKSGRREKGATYDIVFKVEPTGFTE